MLFVIQRKGGKEAQGEYLRICCNELTAIINTNGCFNIVVGLDEYLDANDGGFIFGHKPFQSLPFFVFVLFPMYDETRE